MSRWGQFQEIADLPERAFCENKYERTLEGGGKGGSQSSSVEIPEWAQEATRENLAYAKKAADVGYIPYYGPQVAAFNPTQLAGMQSNIGAAEAFGLVPQGGLTAAQGMPAPTTYAGGFQGYGSGDLYDQALAALQARRPGQASAYNAMFVDPYSGESTVQQDPYAGLDFLNYDYRPIGALGGMLTGAFGQVLGNASGGQTVEINGQTYLKTPKATVGKGGNY